MRVFEGYRPNPPEDYESKGLANPPDEVQYQGIVFKDGVTVIHWCTVAKSTSVFASLEEFMTIHGHPEYGTVIKWADISDLVESNEVHP
jgi:hypothetical protein